MTTTADIVARLRQRLDSTLGPNAAPQPEVSVPPRIPDHELLRCIGRGSYGEVWLARSVTGQLHAVKVVWRRNFSSERPYQREFQGIVRYEPISRSHSAVVPVLHVGHDDADGFFYYVMELADDAVDDLANRQVRERHPKPVPNFANYIPRTLRGDLKRRSRLPAQEVLQLGVQLANALGHLHGHGLVHRDVKPSNVIYIDGQVHLADIGLVTGIDEARSFVGTEGFIAPEGPGTPQADLFALGKLLYEAATGQDRHDFPSLPENFHEWPEREAILELNEVLARTCSPNPRMRHANAAELAGDLNLILAGRSIRRAYSTERRLRRFYHASLAASLVALLAGAGMWFQRARRAEAEHRAAQELALRQRAERAEASHRVALRQALLEQARSLVQSHEPNRRSAALSVLSQASFIAPDADLRTVAAAALATPELRELQSWPITDADAIAPALNATMDIYVRADHQGLISLHRVSDHKVVCTLSNGANRIEHSLFSPDGRWLLTSERGPRLRLWNPETGTNRILAYSSTWVMNFSPDSRFLYRFRSRGNLVRENLATGEQTEFLSPTKPVYAAALQPRLSLIVACHTGSRSLSLINVENGELAEPFRHPTIVMSLAWNPVGDQLIAGTHDGSVWVWDWPPRPTPRHILRYHKREVTRLSVHPGGRWLVSSGWDNQSCLWDLENGQLSAVMSGVVSGVSIDGTRLRLGEPGRGAVIAFNEAFQPWQQRAHRHGASPSYLAFSPDGRWLVTGGEDGAWLWETATWKEVVRLTDQACSGVGIAANASAVLVAGAKQWQAWRLPLQPEGLTSLDLPWAKVEKLLWAGAVEPASGRWISFEEPPRGRGTLLRTGVVGSSAATEMLFEEKSGGNASISPDGRWAARGSWLTNDVWVIDLEGKTPPHRIAHLANTATAFSSDSREVMVCGESVFRFITLGTWHERLIIPREVADPRPGWAAYAHREPLVALQISRSRIRLVRPDDGREYLTLSTHEERHIENLAFSPDDRHLVACAPDQHLIIWDLAALRTQLTELNLVAETGSRD